MNLLKRGVLADNQPFVVNVGANISPMTATLVSADLSRNIELSSDGGNNYYTPSHDVEITSMINVVIMAPISNIRFTGIPGDIWSVR